MEILSDHFTSDEFRCRGKQCCGGTYAVQRELVEALEKLRENLNKKYPRREVKITINSGFRCIVHNREVRGAYLSRHTRGEAADISSQQISAQELWEEAKKIKEFSEGGMGIGRHWIHVDIRKNGPAQWEVLT